MLHKQLIYSDKMYGRKEGKYIFIKFTDRPTSVLDLKLKLLKDKINCHNCFFFIWSEKLLFTSNYFYGTNCFVFENKNYTRSLIEMGLVDFTTLRVRLYFHKCFSYF